MAKMYSQYSSDNNSFDDFEEEKDIDLEAYFLSSIRHKNIILFCAISTTIFSILYGFIAKPIWEGEFQIVLEGDTKGNSILDKLQGNVAFSSFKNMSQSSSLETEVKILESPSVLKPVYDYVKNKKKSSGEDTSRWTYRKWFENQLNISLGEDTSVLTISYQDNNKSSIIPVLNNISKAYQEYSGRDRKQGIDQGIKYIETQLDKIKIKSTNSMKALQSFSLKNSLGSQDGIPFPQDGLSSGLESQINSLDFDDRGNIVNLVNQNSFKGNSVNNTKIRYASHYKKLNELEATLVAKSALLKPNSEIIKNLKLQIESLKNSLTRPRDIVFKYRELKRTAIRDEALLQKLEGQLDALKLEKARQSRPWELISDPTVFDTQVSPHKKKLAIFGLAGGLFAGSLISFLIDLKTGIIFRVKDFKRKIPFPLLTILSVKTKDEWDNKVDLIVSQLLDTDYNESIGLVPLSKSLPDEIKGIVEYFKRSLKERSVICSSNVNEVNSCAKKLLIAWSGSIKYSELESKFSELLLTQNIVGWIYVDND